MCILVSAMTTLVLVAFSIVNLVLPLCTVAMQTSIGKSAGWKCFPASQLEPQHEKAGNHDISHLSSHSAYTS